MRCITPALALLALLTAPVALPHDLAHGTAAGAQARATVLRQTKQVVGDAAIDAGGYAESGGAMDEMDDATRADIWRSIDASVEQLGLKRVPLAKATAGPGFIWPLRPAPGYPHPGYYVISNYVDHDATFPNKLKDFSCQARTYDTEAGYNHKGIDIAMGPDGWNMMAAKAVHIVAAAAGTIVFKSDGNFDRNCRLSSKQWNAVYIQHDDGSTTWYGHMKQGSLTAKPIGARVEAGEYLGSVGSSGNSSGPHLHFEVYDAARRLVDPYAGTCNTLNTDSWWREQKPYREPALTRLHVAGAAPVFSACGEDGTLARRPDMHMKTVFTPGETLHFTTFYRDQVDTLPARLRVLRPDGSVWRQWTHTSDAPHYVSAYWYWTYALEAEAPPGTWTFEVTHNESVATHAFLVQAAVRNTNYAGIWWSPAESGWGLSVSHQADVLTAVLFSYDTDRRDLWAILQSAPRTGAATYTGSLVRPTGTPFHALPFGIDQPVPQVGSMSFTFTSPDSGTVTYTVNGATVSRPISRLVHGSATNCTYWLGSRKLALNYQDLWWNPDQSGWGLNLSHQGESLTGILYTYDTDRRGLWLLLQNVTRGNDGVYSGELLRFTGAPVGSVPFAVDVPRVVGPMRLDFTSGDEARLQYSVDGQAVNTTMQRLVYGTPVTLCR